MNNDISLKNPILSKSCSSTAGREMIRGKKCLYTSVGQSQRRHDFIIYSLHSLCIYAQHTGVSLGYMLLNNTFGFPADTQMYGWDRVCVCMREDLPVDNTIIIHVWKWVRPSEISSTLLSPDLKVIHGIHSSAQRQTLASSSIKHHWNLIISIHSLTVTGLLTFLMAVYWSSLISV